MPLRLYVGALGALQDIAETFVVKLFQNANLVAIHRRSSCVQPVDVELAHRVSGNAALLGIGSTRTAAGRGEVLVATLLRRAESEGEPCPERDDVQSPVMDLGPNAAAAAKTCDNCGAAVGHSEGIPLVMRPGFAQRAASTSLPLVDLNFALLRGLKKLARLQKMNVYFLKFLTVFPILF